MATANQIREMNWRDFVALEEVKAGMAPDASGREVLFYKSLGDDINVFVNIPSELNEMTVLEDQAIAEELQELTVNAYEEVEE